MASIEIKQVFKITEPPTKEHINLFLKRSNLNINRLKKYCHPREDWIEISKKYPIFAIADGVSLEPDSRGNYPHHSGAQDAARIFCKSVIKESEKLYRKFDESSLEHVFRVANQAVGKYNKKHKRTKKTINYWDVDLFATTSAIAVIRDETMYWASLCDAGICHYDKNGVCTLLTYSCWPNMIKNLPKNFEKIEEKERKKIIRQIYRNGRGKQGNLIGYGVVTGERIAEQYLNKGSILVGSGDLIFLFTDGFEEYLRLPEFIKLFKSWPKKLKSNLEKITRKMSKKDPDKFGQERSLITISLK